MRVVDWISLLTFSVRRCASGSEGNPPELLIERSAARFPLASYMAVGLVGLLGGCGSGPRDRVPPSGPSQASPMAISPVVQPGAPGQGGRMLSPGELADLPRPLHTEADVRFMQHMIRHHAQALEMAVLVPDRSRQEEIRLLARRIEISQGSEIALMRRWLQDRREQAPDPLETGLGARHEAGHAAGHEGMPGMLTRTQLHRLASATGDEFDRLFLEYMIYHHEGALIMVAELFASPGAGQGGTIFEFASHVDADQRIEVSRMTRMLNALP